MSARPNLTEEMDILNIPELGDIITIESSQYGSLTGKIIFRDEKLIRVLPIDASDRATDFALDPDDGDFINELKVVRCTIHTKREEYHFAIQLGVAAGETLEFFDNMGQSVPNVAPGIVAEIIADENTDSIILADGRRMDFNFIGPPAPIHVVRVSTQSISEEKSNAPIVVDELPDEFDLSLLEGLIPAAMMEEIPTADRTYPEIIQREEMYLDLLKSYPETKQKNPNLLRRLTRETDLLLALKNAVTVNNEKGEPRPFIKSADSLKDILTNIGSPLSCIIPVLALKRILYTKEDSDERLPENILEQVEFRNELLNELSILRASNAYLAGQDTGGAAQISKLMYTYLYDILYREGSVFLPNSMSVQGEEVLADQEVLRTVLPPEPVIGYSKINKDAELNASYVGPIKTRMHRVISAFKADQNVIAPGDPGTALNYMLLPTNIGSMYRPIKYSGSIAEDIRAAEIAGKLDSLELITNRSNVDELGIQIVKGINNPTAEGDDANTIDVAKWLTANLNKFIHVTDLLNSGSVAINRVLDAIGLRSYEWSPEVAAAIWSSIENAQKIYKTGFEDYRTTVQTYLKTAPPYDFGRVIPADSILFKKSLEVPELAVLINKFASENNELIKAQFFLNSYEGTLARLLYAGCSANHPQLKNIRSVYLAEVHRSSVQFKSLNDELSKYKAEPILNKCPHVRDMEVLRSLMKTDNSKFMAVLQKILTKYQGGRNNNWVDCKVCDGHLICIHEVMLLYERTHPGRAPALHKEILMDYGGAAFSGRYVCRFCGVPISEFEYDNHLEYDDEGRPLMGRNVAEVVVEDELDTILNISVKKKAIAFEDPIQNDLYDLTRVLVQNSGFVFPDSTYEEIVLFSYNYITTELPSRDEYDKIVVKKQQKPTYESFMATNKIAITAAYIICLIHTMNPFPEIMYPFAGCRFKRGGYPIESDKEEDLGAMEYFVCVIANLNRDSAPWNMGVWFTDSDPDKRKKLVRKWIMDKFKSAKNMQNLLNNARTTYTQNIKNAQGMASSKDRLPGYFRPTTNPKPAYFEATAMTHPDYIDSALKENKFGDAMDPIVEQRIYQLACDSVMNAHISAQASDFISETSTRSDSTCCFLPIDGIRKGKVTMFNPPAVESEIERLNTAQVVLQKRDPCQQSNGAHLYVHWSSPEPIMSTAVKPDASYFKLFMRTCFRGLRRGMTHEFGHYGKSYSCRHCHFNLAMDPLVLMSDLNDEEILNNDTKRKGNPITVVQDYARASLKENGVEINADNFRGLLSDVRSIRNVIPFSEPEVLTSEQMFMSLDTLVNTDFPFLYERNVDWQIIVELMKSNFKLPNQPTEEQRAIIWGPFVGKYDGLRKNLLDLFDERNAGKKAARQGEAILNAIERITEEPMYQGANEINKHWVVGLERLAQNFNEMVFGTATWFGQNTGGSKAIQNYFFKGTRWFGRKISGKHAVKFEEMIKNILSTNTDTNKELGNSDIRKFSADVTHRLSVYLGRVIRFWTTELMSFSVNGFTTKEKQYVLRWLIFSSVESLLVTESPLYTAITSDVKKLQVKTILQNWTKLTFIEAKRQFDLFGLTAEEIQMAILDAREKEKNSVISEIDNEKDPDLRAVALVQKNLKIGRWAIGTSKNLSSYNAEFQDFLQEQRDRAGIADNGVVKKEKDDAFGFDMGGAEASAYDTQNAEDEDEETYYDE
jgi:hypothetical protein